MKFPISVAVVLAGSLCGCVRVISHLSSSEGSDTIEATGPETSKTYSVSDFTKIEAGSSFEISYTTGRSRSVSIDAERTALDHIVVSTSDGVLHLSIQGSLSTHRPIRVKIVSRFLDGIELNGAASGEFKGISAGAFFAALDGSSQAKIEGSVKQFTVDLGGASSLELATRSTYGLTATLDGSSKLDADGTASSLTIKANGASEAKLGRIAAKAATLDLDGSSMLEASGTTDMLTVNAGGGSSAELDQVRIGGANVVADGSSKVTLGDTKTLTATAGGASEVRYRGNPKVVKELSGSGSVESE